MLASARLPDKRLHDLRHTYATLLFARDVHPRIAQDLLGHTRIDMTIDLYTGFGAPRPRARRSAAWPTFFSAPSRPGPGTDAQSAVTIVAIVA